MLVTIKKNNEGTWDILPNSGKYEGHTVATAEGVDLTSVVVNTDKVIGMIKAVWGIQIKDEVFGDLETVRALCLGKAFTSEAEHPVNWMVDGIYDTDSGRMLRRCKRMIILGSSIFRRG